MFFLKIISVIEHKILIFYIFENINVFLFKIISVNEQRILIFLEPRFFLEKSSKK